ncbi:hypothetical protein RYX36_023882 [Vicia faba]
MIFKGYELSLVAYNISLKKIHLRRSNMNHNPLENRKIFVFFHEGYVGGGALKKIKNGEIEEGKRVVFAVKQEIERNPLITEAQRRELDHQVGRDHRVRCV